MCGFRVSKKSAWCCCGAWISSSIMNTSIMKPLPFVWRVCISIMHNQSGCVVKTFCAKNKSCCECIAIIASWRSTITIDEPHAFGEPTHYENCAASTVFTTKCALTARSELMCIFVTDNDAIASTTIASTYQLWSSHVMKMTQTREQSYGVMR